MSKIQRASEQHKIKAERVPNTRLKAQRLKKNWTQVYVGTRIGTSDVEISRWETGASIPSLYFREKLCELFSTTPEALGFVSDASVPQEEHLVAPSSALPLPLTSLIGREQEVAEVCAILRQAEGRLLTLTGPGGVGKTRLALHAASEVQEDFADGVCFVSLAPLQDAELVLPTIVRALRLQNMGTQPPLEYLKVALRKQQMLLLLDNFEQVIVATPLLVELLSACPHLKIMVTSRAVLHVRGERVFALQPLKLPGPLHSTESSVVARAGAVALFVERAREIDPDFSLTQETAPLVADICRRLDGLPLAIELAVARLKLFSLPVLKVRLEHRLQLLTGGPRDLPERQQTLRNTLRWSYDLLSEAEQRLFRLLSVFVGGCTLEAVEAISRMLTRIENASVLDGIASLLDKHMLYQVAQGSGETGERRLFMLETIREYGLECLSLSGELKETRQAHAEYYLRLAEEAEVYRYGAEQVWWFDRLEQEHDNLRAALNWFMEQTEHEKGPEQKENALRLAGALVHFWVTRGYVHEGQTWMERALVKSGEGTPLVRAKALSGAAWLAGNTGRSDQGANLYRESLKLYREAKETRGIALSLHWLGWLTFSTGNTQMARSLLEESCTLFRNLGDKGNLAYSLHFLAGVALAQGKDTEVHSLLGEGFALFQEIDNKEGLAWALRFLGRVLFAQGDVVHASKAVEESLPLCREANYKVGLASALDLLGRFALVQGDIVSARTRLEESLALFRTLEGFQQNKAYTLAQLASIAAMQGDSEAARAWYEESFMLFQQMNETRGIAFCLQGWGAMVARQGDPVWAARLWGAAETLSEASSHMDFLMPLEHTDIEHMVSTVRAELGEQAFAKAWAEGRTMTPEQALAMQMS